MLLALAFSGCAAAYSKQPVGETPKSLVTEVEQWEGNWMRPDGSVTVKVKDAAKGVLTIGWIDSNPEGLKPQTTVVFLREVGHWTFASLKNTDKPYLFLWARIEQSDRQIIFWPPDVEKLSALVTAGKLPGTIKDSDVYLGALGAKELKILSSEDEGILFNWDKPVVLFKLGG